MPILSGHSLNTDTASPSGRQYCFIPLPLLHPQTEGAKDKAGESPSPPGTNQTAVPANGAKENGVKDSTPKPMPVPSVGEGLRDPPQAMDKQITGTSK